MTTFKKTNFKKELQEAGYQGTTEQFYTKVATLFAAHCPNQTDEQIKRHPKEAIRFCDRVRENVGLNNLDDSLILGGLENYRKHLKKMVEARADSVRETSRESLGDLTEMGRPMPGVITRPVLMSLRRLGSAQPTKT